MTLASGAIPQKLISYRNIGFYIDHELMAEANRLAETLYRFERTCTEYPVHVSYLAGELRSYANWAQEIDQFVGVVGLDFLIADGAAALETAIDWFERWRGAIGGALLAISIRPGSTYAGQIIINLPNWLPKASLLRKVFEIGPTHIKYTNLVHSQVFGVSPTVVKGTGWTRILRKPVPVALAVSAVLISLKWYQDIVAYRRGDYTGTQLASALTADAGLTLAPVGAGIAGAIAGAKVGAVIGTFIAPVGGTAVGAVVGGIIGGIVAGWGADAALDHFDVREKIIPFLDEKVFQPLARSIAAGVNTLEDFVDVAGQHFRQFLFGPQDGKQSEPPSLIAPTPAPTPKLDISSAPVPASEQNSSPQLGDKLKRIISEIGVEGNDKYQRREDGTTFCNMYVYAIAEKLDVVPHLT